MLGFFGYYLQALFIYTLLYIYTYGSWLHFASLYLAETLGGGGVSPGMVGDFSFLSP